MRAGKGRLEKLGTKPALPSVLQASIQAGARRREGLSLPVKLQGFKLLLYLNEPINFLNGSIPVVESDPKKVMEFVLIFYPSSKGNSTSEKISLGK